MEVAENQQIDISRAGKLACESCGVEFICQADQSKCWCSDVQISPENLTKLAKNFNNCLCRECLEKLSAQK
jgi:Cysteine-rich CWC